MGGYFKPWCRKIGVVTLVMACVFAAGWVRSLTIDDYIAIHGYQFESTEGVIQKTSYALPIIGDYRTVRDIHWLIPYWSIVIPLTLLSAWLLLSKLHKPKFDIAN